MLTVAITNARSGVGKTTLTLGLAEAASRIGLRVLVMDLDPQARATSALSVADPTWTASDVLHAASEGAVAGAACPSQLAGVSLVAAELALAEKDVDASLGAEFALRASLAGVTDYDLVLLDCPPSTGRLTGNALIAASHALVVTSPTPSSLQGAQQVLSTIDTIRSLHRRQIRVAGVLVNSIPPTGREEALTLDTLREQLSPTQVWTPTLPYRPAQNDVRGAASVYDQVLQRLMWLDPIYREDHPDRAPTVQAENAASPVVPIRPAGGKSDIPQG